MAWQSRLPCEIWGKILHYVHSSDNSLNSISCALTCERLMSICKSTGLTKCLTFNICPTNQCQIFQVDEWGLLKFIKDNELLEELNIFICRDHKPDDYVFPSTRGSQVAYLTNENQGIGMLRVATGHVWSVNSKIPAGHR